MRYVDGFVVPVPKKQPEAHLRIARKAGKIWREHGALEYRECVGDDLDAKGLMPFPRMARVKRMAYGGFKVLIDAWRRGVLDRSEASFSRAFERASGLPPGALRRGA